MFQKRTILYLALLSTVPLPAVAQTLEEVVVTARKRAESAQEVPVAVTAIGAELQNASIRNLRDLEGFSPNLTIDKGTSGPGAANISIRGISYAEVDKSLDPSIGVIVDGVYLGTNVGQVLQNFDIERVEVLRGPQGTLFGKNTTGGVVNVIRTKPSYELGGEVRVGTGSWDLQDIKGVLHFPVIQDKLAAKVYAIDTSDDGWLENTTLNEDTARTDSTSYGFSLLANPTDTFELQFSYDYLDDTSDIGGAHNRNGPETLSCQLFGGCEATDKGSDEDHVSTNGHQEAALETDAYTLRMEWDIGAGVFTAISAYRDNDEYRQQEYDASNIDFIALDFWQEYEQTSHELNFASSFSDSVEYVAGLYYWNAEYTQESETIGFLFNTALQGRPPGATSRLMQTQETESTAIYFHGDWHINDALTATLGLRYTEEEKDFMGVEASTWLNGVQLTVPDSGEATEDWNETTGKLGLRYQYSDDVMIFGSFAQGFKSGGFLGRNTTIAGFTAVYDPEYVDTFELGIKSDWMDGRVRLNATAFYTEYTDKQEEVFFPLSDGSVGTVVLNAGEVEMPGLELELTAAVTENLRIRASYGYLDAEYTEYDADINNDGTITDNTHLLLRRAPENTFGAGATYTRNFDNFDLVADIAYSWRDEYETNAKNNPIAHVDAWGTWSASADLVYNQRYQLSVYGRNLTDERTLISTTPIGPLVTFGRWNQPRNWGVEFRYMF